MGSSTISLDSIASQMAAKAGIVWERLSDHPGYLKNIWRDEARQAVLDVEPTAKIQPWSVRRFGRLSGGQILNTRRKVF
jgi:hypothetical protein